MDESILEDFIIPLENISKIDWTVPRLHYDFPEKLKTNILKKELHDDLEHNDFGCIKRIKRCSCDDLNPKFSMPDESRNNNIGGRNILYSKKE